METNMTAYDISKSKTELEENVQRAGPENKEGIECIIGDSALAEDTSPLAHQEKKKLKDYIISSGKGARGLFFDYPVNAVKFIFLPKHREKQTMDYWDNRINIQKENGYLDAKKAELTHKQLEEEVKNPYFTDFLFHMGMKPILRYIEVAGIPSLCAAGVIDAKTMAITLGLSFAFGGTVTRSAYTLGRMAYDKVRHRAKKPRKLALAIGTIPLGGNLAYPAQMVYTAFSKNKELAQFILEDTSLRIKENIPILGRKNAKILYFFNQLPGYIAKNRKEITCQKDS